MTREESIEQAKPKFSLDHNPYDTQIARDWFETGARWADSHPLNPWKSVKEMPVNVWCYCRDNAYERPYLAIIEDTGECFNEDMDVCFPKYFMPIPETPKEDTK